jgi:autotransporter translocation and assembly factor TamB
VKTVVPKKMLIGSVGILLAALLIYNLPLILLGEKVLTRETGRKVHAVLGRYGLACNVKKVRWIGGGRFEAVDVAIIEPKSGEMMIKADRLLVKVDFMQLLRHIKNPETVLRELEIIRPQFRVVHYANQTWNFSRFFGKKSKRPMKYSYQIKVRDGRGEWEDYQYGKHRFQGVNGTVDLSDFPLVTWQAQGRTTFGANTTWNSRGQVRSDQASGRGMVRLERVPLVKTFTVLDKKFPFTVKSGVADGTFNFAWKRRKVWVQNGAVEIDNSVVKFPFLKRVLLIKTAKADFTPEQVVVNSSKLNYQQSQLQLTGLLDINRLMVRAKLDSKRSRVEDLLEMFPRIPDTAITGRAAFNLSINGLIRNPVFDGQMTFNRAVAVVHDEKFTDITGKLLVNKNNIRVTDVKGTWLEAPVSLDGDITNIYNPRLNLDVSGRGVKLERSQLCQMLKPDLNFGSSADFKGKFTGYWDMPLFSGEVQLEQLAVRNVAAQDLKATITWEPMLQRVKIFSVRGKAWNGDLSAKGLLTVDPVGMSWNLTGEIAGFDLKAIKQLPDIDFAGENLAADAVFKGSWKYDAPFDPGTVMGVVRGSNFAYGRYKAEEASAVYHWHNGALTVESLQVKLGSGRIFGNLTFVNSQLAANISAENLQLPRVLAHEKSLAALDGVFMGNLTLKGDLDNFKAKVNGEFINLAWEQRPIGVMQGELEYDHNRKEVAFSDLILNGPTGDFRIQGKVNLAAGSPQLAVLGDSENLKLKQFLTWLPVKLPVDTDGIARVNLAVNGTVANPDFECRLELATPQIGGVKLDQGLLCFNGNLNKINLTKFELLGSHARVLITGMVEPDNLDLVIGGYCSELESMQLCYRGNLLRGRLDLDGKIVGSLQTPVLTATLNGAEISFGDLKYPQMTARMKWAASELKIYDATLSGSDNSISAGGKINTAESLRCDLDIDVKNFQLQKLIRLANLQLPGFEGKFNGDIIMDGPLDNPQIHLNGNIAEGNLNSVPVTGEVTLSYGDDKLLIEKLGLCHSTGTFYASGSWEEGKSLQLRGRLNEFPLQTINPWLTSSGLALAGLASADIGLEWSSNGFSCDYRLESSGLQVNNDQWGSAFLAGDMNERGIKIDEGNLNVKNGGLEVSGFIPWPEQNQADLKPPRGVVRAAQPLDFQMFFKNVPANLLNSRLPNFKVGSGAVNGKLYVTGNFNWPEFSGELEYSDGQLEFPDLPLRVDAIQAAIMIDKNHLFINNRATGTVGKGRISLTGEVDLGDWRDINLNLDCEGAKVLFKNYFFDGYADFNLKLAGTFAAPLLMGNVNVYDTKVGGLSLAGGKKNAKNEWTPKLDLLIKMGKKVRYRQIGVADVSVNGALHVKGNLAEPLMGGEIKTSQGTISFYGQTFKVDQGKAVFSYAQGINPNLEIEASLPTRKAVIYLKAKGQVGTEILPVLSSQPALTQKEIFALLNWSDLSGEKPLTVGGMVEGNMGMVTDTLFGDVFYQIRDAVGFDYLYLETDYRSNEYRIFAGDYITKKLFISYTRYLVTTDEDEKDKWNFDYHFTPEIAGGCSYSTTEGRAWRLIYTFDF